MRQGDRPKPQSEYGDEWWRPWCTQHWGTTSEPLGALVSTEEGCLSYSFETVWAAPAPWAAALAAAHPELTIELYYGECDNLYSGCMRFVGGAKVGHVGGPYDRFFEFDFDGCVCESEYEALEAHYDTLGFNVRGNTFIGTFQRGDGPALHLGWNQDHVWQLAVHYWRGFVEGSHWMEPPASEEEARRIAWTPAGAAWRDGFAATHEQNVRFFNAVKKLLRFKFGTDWHRRLGVCWSIEGAGRADRAA